MNYSFTTEILGVQMEVEGVLDTGEAQSMDCPGYEAFFEIDTITHKGEELEVDGFPDSMLAEICGTAMEAIENEASC